jgi:hypothetical protein
MAPRRSPDIFLNYRTRDEHGTASHIAHALDAAFGTDAVFWAGDSIPAGDNWPESLLAAVRGCSVLLAVIGKNWLDVVGTGPDWTRREIAEALAHKIVVIPILVDDTRSLQRSELPPDIRGLADLQYIRVRNREHKDDLAKLIRKITRRVPGLATKTRRRRTLIGLPVALIALVIAALIVVNHAWPDSRSSDGQVRISATSPALTPSGSHPWISIQPRTGGPANVLQIDGVGFPVRASRAEQGQRIEVWIDATFVVDAFTDDVGDFQATFDPVRQAGRAGRLSVGDHIIHSSCNGNPTFTVYGHYLVRP